jgi:hypothetical protein
MRQSINLNILTLREVTTHTSRQPNLKLWFRPSWERDLDSLHGQMKTNHKRAKDLRETAQKLKEGRSLARVALRSMSRQLKRLGMLVRPRC